MKCISCGGECRLTDEVCPYCGRQLVETSGYRSDIKKYKGKNEKTQKILDKVASENVPMIISVLVMVLLLTGIGVMIYINDNAYTFREEFMRKKAEKNYEGSLAEIQKYLDAGDYTGFASYIEYNNIYVHKGPFEDLKLLGRFAEKYVELVNCVEKAVVFGDNAERYNPEESVSDCRWAICFFYQEYDYYSSEIEEDSYKEYIYDMKKKADKILEIYLGMDGDEITSFLQSSENEQEVYLEEVLMPNE